MRKIVLIILSVITIFCGFFALSKHQELQNILNQISDKENSISGQIQEVEEKREKLNELMDEYDRVIRENGNKEEELSLWMKQLEKIEIYLR